MAKITASSLSSLMLLTRTDESLPSSPCALMGVESVSELVSQCGECRLGKVVRLHERSSNGFFRRRLGKVVRLHEEFKWVLQTSRPGMFYNGPDLSVFPPTRRWSDLALVDAPDMVRGQMNFKRLTLTDITIDINRAPKKKDLVKAMEAADVKNKWENSSWGRKFIVQKRRAALSDFDRFKLMLAKIKKASLVREELAKLKKQTAA